MENMSNKKAILVASPLNGTAVALEQVPDMDEAVDRFLNRRFRGQEPDQKELKRTIDALVRRGHSWHDIRAGLRRYSDALDADLEDTYE